MRIAVFIKSTTLHANHGGLETQNWTLVEGLARAGNDVVVFSPKKEFLREEAFQNGVRYRFIDSKYKNEGFLQSILNPFVKKDWYEKSFEVFKTSHDLLRFDIVLSQSSAGLGVIRRKDELSIPVVSIAHGTIVSEFKTLLARPKTLVSFLYLIKDLEYTLRTLLTTQREFIRKSDAIIAVSREVQKSVARETGVGLTNIKVIYNGVHDPGKRKDAGIKACDLLYVGRIEADKGLYELLACFEELCKRVQREITLTLVGTGMDEERLKERASLLSCGKSVFFAGYQSGENLDRIYKSAGIFVFPTKRVEGFPMVVPEAAMASLPIVAMGRGGVSEGVIENETGFILRPGDWDEFLEKLEVLVNDDPLRVRMGEKARELAKEEFSEEKMIKKYLDVFEECLKK